MELWRYGMKKMSDTERDKRLQNMQRNIFLDIEPYNSRDFFYFSYKQAQAMEDLSDYKAASKKTIHFLFQQNIPVYRIIELVNRYDPFAESDDYGMKTVIRYCQKHHIKDKVL